MNNPGCNGIEVHLRLPRKGVAFLSSSVNSLSGLSCSRGCTSVGIFRYFQQIHSTCSPSSVQRCLRGVKIGHVRATFRGRRSPKELMHNELLYARSCFFFICAQSFGNSPREGHLLDLEISGENTVLRWRVCDEQPLWLKRGGFITEKAPLAARARCWAGPARVGLART